MCDTALRCVALECCPMVIAFYAHVVGAFQSNSSFIPLVRGVKSRIRATR